MTDIVDWLRNHCIDVRGDVAAAEITRLREENERLKAEVDRILECNRLALERNDLFKKELASLKVALAESQANDRCGMSYLSEIRAVVGGDDFPDMVRRIKELKAQSSEPVAFWLCEGCGHYYQEPVTNCDCLSETPIVKTLFYTAAPRDEVETLRRDAERLDFLAADAGRCIHGVGDKWYYRTGYGKPYHRANSLRAAIDAARKGEE